MILCSQSGARHQRGSISVILLAVLFLVLAFSVANHAALRTLKREIQLIEQRQVARPGVLKPAQPAVPAKAANTVESPTTENR